MILSGTITSSPVAGATVAANVDDNAPTGFVPVGQNNLWVARPGGVGAVIPQVAAVASQTVDWSTGSVIQYLLGQNTTFAYTNVTVGQTITLVLTQDGTGSRPGTFPAGSVFVGGSKTLTTTAAGIDTVQVTCTAPGVYLCSLLKAYA